MSGPPGLGMVAQRRAMHGMRARSGSQRTPAPPSSSGVPQRTRADTSAGRVAARWSARSAPSDMPATASAGTSRRRRSAPSATDANQSVQRVPARSATSVPWPARRTARTGKPAAASASPSGRISSGVAVKPWTRRQPTERDPPSANPSPAPGLPGNDLERTFAVRALLQVIHVGAQHRLLLLLEQALAERVLGGGKAGHVGGDP